MAILSQFLRSPAHQNRSKQGDAKQPGDSEQMHDRPIVPILAQRAGFTPTPIIEPPAPDDKIIDDGKFGGEAEKEG